MNNLRLTTGINIRRELNRICLMPVSCLCPPFEQGIIEENGNHQTNNTSNLPHYIQVCLTGYHDVKLLQYIIL